MMSGTGCLGLSLRTTAITAGVITLVESAVWTVLAVAGYLAYRCTFTVPDDQDIHLRLTYIIYFLDPTCQTDLRSLTPVNQTEDLSLTEGGKVVTAEQTFSWCIVYFVISMAWLATSSVFLGTLTSRVRGRVGARLCYPWLFVSAVTLVTDLVAAGLHAANAVSFASLDGMAAATNVRIPAAWIGPGDPGLALKAGALIMMGVNLRGVVLWLLNGVLLVHGVRAVRAMTSPASKSQEPAASHEQPASVSPRDDRPVVGDPYAGEVGPAVVPVGIHPHPAHWPGGSAPGTPRAFRASRASRVAARGQGGPLQRTRSDRALPRRDHDWVRLPKDHEAHLISREENLLRVARLADPPRTAGPAAWPAAEHQTSRRVQRQASWGGGGYQPYEHANQLEENQEYLEYQEHQGYQERQRYQEYQDASRGLRVPRRVDRTHSDRVLSGEWSMAPRGNLHGLSPAMSAMTTATYPADALKPMSDVIAELKREMPYIRTPKDTVFPRSHTPSPKVVHNIYLPLRRD